MRKLIVILLLVTACGSPKEIEEVLELKAECERLLNDDYDPAVYPDDECRCIYQTVGPIGLQSSYEWVGHWTPKEWQMYNDSSACGFVTKSYGSGLSIVRTDVQIGEAVLKCDC